jgi:hypothetical protein
VGDIKNCFGSMKHDGVRGMLPLPGSVVDHVVLLSEETPIHFGSLPEYITTYSAKKKALEGIPQGSLVSPLVARTLLDPTLRASALGGEVVSFSDDFLVFARTQGEAVAIKHALTHNLSSHPSGPFALKRLYINPVTDWFGFLGLRIRAHVVGGKVQMIAAPSNKSLQEFADELERRVLAGASPEQVHDYIVAWSHTKNWDLADEYAIEVFQSGVLGAVLNSRSDCFEAALTALVKILG